MRGLSHGLDPIVENQPLPILLEQLARSSRQLFGVECVCHIDAALHLDRDLHLSSEAKLHLQRIALEAVHNAVRHGQARHIEIRWGANDGTPALSIADDGCGIRKQHGSGIGLRGMQYRAQAIGGKLLVAMRPEGGTLVTCMLLNPAALAPMPIGEHGR